MILTILQGDALEKLLELPDESVHCCVTSPPYWGLRDYGTASWEGGDEECNHKMPATGGNPLQGANKGNNNLEAAPFKETCGKCDAKRIDSQLGLEKTPEEYVAKMVEIFREVRRVLRKDGTLWLNLGDSYAGQNCGSQYISETTPSMQTDELLKIRMLGSNKTDLKKPTPKSIGLKPKDLVGIPWRVAFALQADGWWLRQDIIWNKPNPMPESVTDRCTKSHEYLFLLTKSARYFYDAGAIKERGLCADDPRKDDGRLTYNGKRQGGNGEGQEAFVSIQPNRNKRSVWTVATAPYPEAHFATYPSDLIKPCIMAGTSAKGCCAKCGAPWERVVKERKSPHVEPSSLDRFGTGKADIHRKVGGQYQKWLDENPTETVGWQPTCECVYRLNGNSVAFNPIPCTVLDPFAGSGTTGAVALELGRKAILIELNPKYVELIEQRCNVTMGLALA